jgi:hypothetical protein
LKTLNCVSLPPEVLTRRNFQPEARDAACSWANSSRYALRTAFDAAAAAFGFMVSGSSAGGVRRKLLLIRLARRATLESAF